jgi:hypothetical protein
MTNAAFLTSITAEDRDAVANPAAILEYLMITEFRNSSIYGRIAQLAAVQADPVTGDYGSMQFGASNALVAITRRHVAAAHAVIRLAQSDSGLSVPLTNTQLSNILSDLVTTGGGAQIMAASNRTAVIALSQNKHTRATEIGLPLPSLADVGRTS